MFQVKQNKLILAVCIAAFGVAVLIAKLNPVVAYEASIYSGTPLTYWIGIFIAVTCAGTLIVRNSKPYRSIGIILLPFCMLSVVALPLVRDYWMINSGDPLTHIGSLRDFEDGASEFESFYPGIYLLARFLKNILELNNQTALLGLASIFFSLFVTGFSVTMRNISYHNQRGLIIGTIVALSLLPINLIATHIFPHPNSYTILYSVFGLLVLSRYYSIQRDWRFRAILLLTLISIVIYHPQHAINILLVVLGFWVVFSAPNWREHISDPLILGASSIAIVWTVWTISRSTFKKAFQGVLLELARATTVDATAGRGSSFSSIGTNIIDIAVRLFILDFILLVFALVAVIYSIVWLMSFAGKPKSLDESTQIQFTVDQKFIVAVIISSVPILFFFSFFLLSGVTQQFMRYVGFGMLLASVLVASGLSQITTRISHVSQTTLLKNVLVVLLVSTMALSAITYHHSPVVYKESGHVTEASVEGFEWYFENHAEGTTMMSVRSKGWRYAQAIYGVKGSPMTRYTDYRGIQPPDHFANHTLHNEYPGDRVLVSRAATRYLDTELYNGFRFSADDFVYLNQESEIQRAYDNGDTRVYYIPNGSSR